ncbi:hypothetical protein OA525_01695 [Alphaproteobacteria bacterium]|nr:hypothetical protein [Alphaproteobacteria bacterium]
MLKKEKKINYQELNFFYLLSILYKNLILFIFISVIPIIVCFLYFMQTEDKFNYTLQFDQNYTDFEDFIITCHYESNHRPCRYDIYLNKLLLEYKPSISFRIHKNTLLFEQIKSLEEFKNIYNFLLVSNEQESKYIYEQAKEKLKMINEILYNKKYNFYKDDFFISRLYYYNELISKYEKDENLFRFGMYSANKQRKFSKSFLLMLIIFSPIISCAVIYIKENKNLIKQL